MPVPSLVPEDPSPDRKPLRATLALVVVTNALVIAHVDLKIIGPALGFWLIVVHPVYLLYTTSVWNRASASERVAYSLASTLLLLLVGGLIINTALPWAGVDRPLDSLPVLILVDVINGGLYLFRQRHPDIPSWRQGLGALGREEIRLIVASGACIPLVVLGANRLNNQSGDQVTMIALGVIVVSVILLLSWSERIASGVTGVTIYLLSASLLLMTSLRGWSVSGHDIQLEYRVFQLTVAHGRWNMNAFKNAFNACLSITILPTQVAALMHIDDPYVFKVFFQLIFAACPVIVYAIARRYFSQRISILSAIYFVGFPTFFTDMPFLNRQEMALIFVAAAILAVTNPSWRKRRRQVALVAAVVGMELSHYSSTYVFLGTLTVAWVTGQVLLLGRLWPKRTAGAPPGRRTRWADMGRTVGLGCLMAVAAITVAWGGLATHTAGGAVNEIKSAISGHSGGARSSAVSYGLISGKAASAQSALDKYRDHTLHTRASAAPGTFLPADMVAGYPTPVVNQPDLPLTGLGRVLSNVGISPTTLNTDVRQLAAKGEQVFVVIGLLAILLSRRLSRAMGREFFYLCIGGLVMLALITVLPELSVEYGVLRVFQEELILIAPIMVVGSITLFRPLGNAWSQRIAMTICVLVFVSTTGLLPQVLGGYPAQLNLNNSGIYYDVYYTHPQEVAAISWLYGKPDTLPGGIQVDYNSDRFAFTSPSEVTGSQYLYDYFPTLVGRSTWVVLGDSVVQSGQATVSVDGNLITYRYPIGLLGGTKNLVYNNGKTRIYR